jgi:hypothetical protein
MNLEYPKKLYLLSQTGTSANETSMLKILKHNRMINSEQHLTIKKKQILTDEITQL